jgi:hypothetical protein
MIKLKNKIKELIDLQLYIDNNGGLENNFDNFEIYLEKRQGVLKHFGLPDNDYFNEVFYVKESFTDETLSNIIEKLKIEAEKFLLTETKPDAKIIDEAKRELLTREEVFMQIGVKAHIYTFYVFDNILLENKDTNENIAYALNLTKEEGMLNNLGIAAMCTNYGEEEYKLLENLRKRNIPYLQEYLDYYESERVSEKN